MSMLRGILDRFRPAPPPGRPGPIGVPSEGHLTAADELAPVFAALANVESECAAIRSEGARGADEIWRAAAERVQRIEADAAERAEEARAMATLQLQGAAQLQRVHELTAAQQQADALYSNGLRELEPYVAAAVAAVRALASAAEDGVAT
jgi:hypothetical protein